MQRSHRLVWSLVMALLIGACGAYEGEDVTEFQNDTDAVEAPALETRAESAEGAPSADDIDPDLATGTGCAVGNVVISTTNVTGFCCVRTNGLIGTLRRSAWSPNTYLCVT